MKRKVLFVLCLLLGLLFINAGLDKFFHYMPIPEDLPEPMVNMSMSMMEVSWPMPLVGFFGIVGGLLLIRSEEHTYELQTIMHISYAVFCMKKNKTDYTLKNMN